jgi:two-component system response regulator MprA
MHDREHGGSPQRLLIVEDDDGLREGLRINFEYEGYRVTTAAEGRRGLELALSSNPSLMILDIMLPGMNGLDVCRRIRAAGHAFPVLMLTVRRSESERAEGLRSGADDYVGKPFSLTELSERVRTLLRKKRPISSHSRSTRRSETNPFHP